MTDKRKVKVSEHDRLLTVYRHEVTCESCGRHFAYETTIPIPPRYCLRDDNPICYEERKKEYMREYMRRRRAKAKGRAHE